MEEIKEEEPEPAEDAEAAAKRAEAVSGSGQPPPTTTGKGKKGKAAAASVDGSALAAALKLVAGLHHARRAREDAAGPSDGGPGEAAAGSRLYVLERRSLASHMRLDSAAV